MMTRVFRVGLSRAIRIRLFRTIAYPCSGLYLFQSNFTREIILGTRTWGVYSSELSKADNFYANVRNTNKEVSKKETVAGSRGLPRSFEVSSDLEEFVTAYSPLL